MLYCQTVIDVHRTPLPKSQLCEAVRADQQSEGWGFYFTLKCRLIEQTTLPELTQRSGLGLSVSCMIAANTQLFVLRTLGNRKEEDSGYQRFS